MVDIQVALDTHLTVQTDDEPRCAAHPSSLRAASGCEALIHGRGCVLAPIQHWACCDGLVAGAVAHCPFLG